MNIIYFNVILCPTICAFKAPAIADTNAIKFELLVFPIKPDAKLKAAYLAQLYLKVLCLTLVYILLLYDVNNLIPQHP